MLIARRPPTTERVRPRPRSDAERLVELLTLLGGTTFRRLLWRKSAELELTYAQSQVLSYIAEHAGCHMGDIGRAFAVTLPAVTHIVDRLEQKGFVVRGDDPVDRRAYVLRATANGRALADELRALRLRGVEPLLACLSPSDRERVIEGLARLVEAASEATARAADDRAARNRRGNGHG